MKRKILFGFIAVCSLVLNIAFIAMWLTHAAPRFMMTHQSCRVDKADCQKCPLYKTLALSDSQWSVLRPHVEAYRHLADSLLRELSAAREALITELARTPTDTAALTMCRERILNGQRKMQEQVVANVLAQKAVLTPEQQQRFIETVRNSMACERMPGMIGMMNKNHLKDGCVH